MTEIVLPKIDWAEPAAVASYIISVFSGVLAVLTMVGTVVPAGTTAEVKVWAGIAALFIAGGVQIFNLVTHRSLQKALIAANSNVQVAADYNAANQAVVK